jgi:hypothetical protein
VTGEAGPGATRESGVPGLLRAPETVGSGAAAPAGSAPATSGGPDRHASVPSAASVLRRALLVWGLGHLALGDRRGWAFAVLELCALAALAVAAIAFLTTDRANLVFVALCAFMAVWGAQAIDAYVQAVARGGRRGGAVQLLALTPIGIALFTAFWVVGGVAGTPAATLQRYVQAWRDGVPEAGAPLFLQPPPADVLREAWAEQDRRIGEQLRRLAASLGPEGGIEPEEHFDDLAFEFAPAVRGPRRGDSVALIRIVHRVTVESTFFGLFPVASQQTEVLEDAGRVVLRPVTVSRALGLPAIEWRIAAVEVPPGQVSPAG